MIFSFISRIYSANLSKRQMQLSRGDKEAYDNEVAPRDLGSCGIGCMRQVPNCLHEIGN
jgi:hypothetical protein